MLQRIVTLFTSHIFIKSKHRSVVLASLIVGIILIFALLTQSYHSYQNQISKAKNDLTNVTRILEDHTKGILTSGDIILKDIIQSIEDKGPNYKWDKNKYSELLGRKLNYLPYIQGIKLTDENGNYLGSENGKWLAAGLGDREYFKDLKNNPKLDSILSKPVISKTTGDWVMVLARKLKTKDGTFKGMIILTFPLKVLSDLYSRFNIGEHGLISLYTIDEYVLLNRYPFSPELLGKKISNSNVYNAIKSAKNNFGLVSTKSVIDNIERIFCYQLIPESNIMIISAFAYTDLLKNWYFQTSWLVLTIIISYIGFIIFLNQFLKSLDALEVNRIQLVKSAKLSVLGEMAGGIAHEINNPLSIIQGRAYQLNKLINTEPIDKEKIEKIIKSIHETVDRIAKIIKGLKIFSRNSDGDPLIPTQLYDIIIPTLALCQERFTSRNIELRLNEIPKAEINCRSTQISQVILNLLGNAYDAIADQPNCWVEINYEIEKEYIYIKITDSGLGIPKEIATKIMQPFFTTKPFGQGTGLGLSISVNIIKEHNGDLTLNTSSTNTQFIIKLPLFNGI